MTASAKDPRSVRHAGQHEPYAGLYERYGARHENTSAATARDDVRWSSPVSQVSGHAAYDAGGHGDARESHGNDYAGADWDILPDDRVGPPLVRKRGRLVITGVLLLAIAAGGVWAVRDGPSFWAAVEQVWSAVAGMAGTVMERSTPPLVTTRETVDAGALLPPLSEQARNGSSSTTVPNVAEDGTAATVAGKPETGETEPEGASASAPPEPLPPPPPIATLDAHQKRAAAAGLHTDLSRALLERLTDADYRNAAIAIRMAFAENDETTVLIWPRQAQPSLAQYQVHFVPGAPGCRRYVVTIAKLGWSTTAMPLERCGGQRKSG